MQRFNDDDFQADLTAIPWDSTFVDDHDIDDLWSHWYKHYKDTMSVFHLPKNSGNFGRVVNGTRLFGSFHWKFSGINGIPEKVVPFSQWKFPNGKFVFHLQIYCLITSSMSFAVY